MNRLDIREFYDFDEKLANATLHAEPVGLISGDETIKGDVTKLLTGDYENITFPVVFKRVYGKRLDDVIRTGTAILYLISDRMKVVLEENRLTGWQVFPVRVLDKKDNDIPGYHGLSIIGRCGLIDYSKSPILEKRLVEHGPICKYYKGLYVGLDEWDGSDFFLARGYFGTIVTAKAAEVLRKSKLSNIRLENLSDVEVDVEMVESSRPSLPDNLRYF